MAGSLTQNMHIKILSLLLATIFWFFVLSSENTFFTYPDALEIESFNVPEGLAVVNDLGNVNVTLRTDQDVYKSLTPENFTVYVDLKGLAAGSKDVDLSVNSKKANVSVVDISPPSVTVILEEVTTKEVPLSIVIEGEAAENYTTYLSSQSVSTVTLSGAPSVLETIDEAVATLELSGNEVSDVTQSLQVVVYDANGDDIDIVTASPETVDVQVGVELEQSQKSVGVKVNTSELSSGWVSSVSVVPSVVLIEGDTEILDQIQYLETETIILPSDSSYVEETATLMLPTGVRLANGESDTVEVTLSINIPEEEED